MTALFDESALIASVRARLLVLDVDGVLLDPKPSFYKAAIEAAVWAVREVVPGVGVTQPAPVLDERHVGILKSIGGWNDDFDLACALAWAGMVETTGRAKAIDAVAKCAGGLERAEDVLAGIVGGSQFAVWLRALPVRKIRSRTAARYAGRDRMHALYSLDPADFPGIPDTGLWTTEPLLCDPALLAHPPWDLALFTGRNPGEAGLALDRFSLTIDPTRCMVDDGSRARKPAPDGLLALSKEGLGMVFVGDSIDDQRAAVAYKQAAPDGPRLTFVRVLADADAATRLDARRTGADIVVSSLPEFLALAKDARQV